MPEPQKINFNNILRAEEKGKLSLLDKDFYQKSHDYIIEIENNLKNYKRGTLQYYNVEDELNSSIVDFEKIVDIRIYKIVLEALSHKSLLEQKKLEPEGLTPEELELYRSLLDQLSNWRNRRIYPGIEAVNPPEIIIDKKPEVKKPDLTKDYILIRALINVPTFAGMDNRNYTLTKEDVVNIPAINAKTLIARKAAVEVRMRG